MALFILRLATGLGSIPDMSKRFSYTTAFRMAKEPTKPIIELLSGVCYPREQLSEGYTGHSSPSSVA
jgi:hypothetical protein